MSKQYKGQSEETSQQKNKGGSTQRFEDNRESHSAVQQMQNLDEEELMQGKFEPLQKADLEEEELMQKKANNTGLPDNLKSGMENLSGISLDHVNVHYNSSKPAAVQAHAYAQGSDIHLASGQEQHLPHELGHVVQQAQGRVQPTTSVEGMQVNDNPGLESEATIMGAKALQMAKKDY